MENESLLADREPLEHRQHFFPGNLPKQPSLSAGLSPRYPLLVGNLLIILSSLLHCIKIIFLYLRPTLE